jgi:ribosomal protein L37AE/L43A
MYIVDPEMYKPLQCTKCKSREIAKMLNTGMIKCLNCGREKEDTNDWRFQVVKPIASDSVYTRRVNKNPFRDF